MTIQLDIIHTGECLEVLETLPDESVHCCVTSPPYDALRDYSMEEQIGREATPKEYISRLTEVFTDQIPQFTRSCLKENQDLISEILEKTIFVFHLSA